ncbi:MAG TPA: hypothetical protein VD968_18035, partial [Pyrinomonadaceae bacterium]|nr:hypothetical protein [Pyrinomonadaceae bacterium]
MLLDESNRKLVSHVQKALGALVGPLGESIRQVWRGGGAPEPKAVLDNHLTLMAQRFIDLREASESEKQRYYEDVCTLFLLPAAPDTFPLRQSNDIPPHLIKRLDRTPVVVSYLETYDSRHGTNHADRARHALFEFANLVIKSDGRISEVERYALAEFKDALFPAGQRPPGGVPGAPPGAKDPATAGESEEAPELGLPRPLEELMAELDALVGLERVKRDVRDLINFLKVQKMREE